MPTESVEVFQSDTDQFRKSLLQAARQARKNGTISIGQHFAILVMARSPAKLEEWKNAMHELAVEDGLATTQAIDWDALLTFIEKLIPIIIKLIGLFG